MLTFYGGFGFDRIGSKLAMLGTYDLDNNGTIEFTDPLTVIINQGGARATLGMRLKLWVFTFHGGYTFQKYNTLSVGFGINIRD